MHTSCENYLALWEILLSFDISIIAFSMYRLRYFICLFVHIRFVIYMLIFVYIIVTYKKTIMENSKCLA